ncbi:MAG: zinc ribbon domain-containing protein [Desulfobulbaceae bacterium]|nr:zinc ribbon domain-containing protein [Desulfobulbaceae bacterium]
MPIYEFKCSDCSEEFETLVFRSDEQVTCPQCDGDKVKRLMSACGYKSSGGSDGSARSAGSSGCSGCTSSNCGSCH